MPFFSERLIKANALGFILTFYCAVTSASGAVSKNEMTDEQKACYFADHTRMVRSHDFLALMTWDLACTAEYNRVRGDAGRRGKPLWSAYRASFEAMRLMFHTGYYGWQGQPQPARGIESMNGSVYWYERAEGILEQLRQNGEDVSTAQKEIRQVANHFNRIAIERQATGGDEVKSARNDAEMCFLLDNASLKRDHMIEHVNICARGYLENPSPIVALHYGVALWSLTASLYMAESSKILRKEPSELLVSSLQIADEVLMRAAAAGATSDITERVQGMKRSIDLYHQQKKVDRFLVWTVVALATGGMILKAIAMAPGATSVAAGKGALAAGNAVGGGLSAGAQAELEFYLIQKMFGAVPLVP